MDHDVQPEVVDEGPRQVRLVAARIDPWSVLKLSFLLSVALGLAMVIAVGLMWLVLDGMHVFSYLEQFTTSLNSDGSAMNSLVDFLRLPRVLAMTTVFAVMNVILITALATVGAMLYNLATTLVGGIRLTLMDE